MLKTLRALILSACCTISFNALASNDADYFEIYNLTDTIIYGQEGWFNRHFYIEAHDYFGRTLSWGVVRDLHLGRSKKTSGMPLDEICENEIAKSYHNSVSLLILPDYTCELVVHKE